MRTAPAPALVPVPANLGPGQSQGPRSLSQLKLLDTEASDAYDDVVALAASLCAVPMAVVNLIDEQRQWFKARLGLPPCSGDLEGSFCVDALKSGGTLVVADAREDLRFARRPQVVGEPRIVFYAGVPLRLDNGLAVGVLAVMDRVPRQLTAVQMQNLQALARQVVRLIDMHWAREQQASLARRLEEAQAVACLGSWELEVPSGQLFWSTEVYRLFGLDAERDRLQPSFELFMRHVHEDDREAMLQAQRRVLAGEAALDQVHRIVRADGSLAHVHERATLSPDGLRLTGTVQDVTAAVWAEAAQAAQAQALQALGARLQRACALGQLGAWEVQVPSGTLSLSDEILAILGYPAGTVLSLDDALGHFEPESRARVAAALEQAMAQGRPYDELLALHNVQGQRRWVRSQGMAVHNAAGQVCELRGAFQDVTHLTETQRRLQAREKQLQEVLESTSDAVLIVDATHRVCYANGRAGVMLQSQAPSLIGAALAACMPDASDAPLRTAAEQLLRGGEAARVELECLAPGRRIELSAYPCAEGMALHLRDVTAQRRDEQRAQQVRHLQALAQLGGGIAHDFNNLLQVIQGQAEALMDSLPADGPWRPMVQRVDSAAERAAELTRRLLAMARRQPLQPQAVDLPAWLALLAPALRRQLGPGMTLTLPPLGAVPPVWADPAQLENALMCLAENAREAMPGGGALTLSTVPGWMPDESVSADPAAAAETRREPVAAVRLCVADTGCGMSPALARHAFEPFFSTKPQRAAGAAGLGLAMVYGFARQSGGHAELVSQLGRGTTVCLSLPQAPGIAAEGRS